MRKIITVSIILFFLSIITAEAQFSRSTGIVFRLNSISETKDGPNRAGKSFNKGDKIWFSVNVSGLMKDKMNDFDIEADFTIMDNVRKTEHGKGKVMNKKAHAGKANSFNLHFSIQIGPKSKPGRHNLEIEVKDKVAKKYNKYHISFDVK